MKIGDLIINPYVSKMCQDKIHPLYKTLIIHIDSANVHVLTFDGSMATFHKRDVRTWEIDGHLDLKGFILDSINKE